MPKRPQIAVFAGPNGSGKTTLYKRVQNYPFLRGLPYINPDEILKEKPITALEAGAEALRLRHRYLSENRSFIFETTLSGNSELKLIRKAKAQGYKINLVYISLGDISLNIMRVNSRVHRGGHDVPAIDIVRRASRSQTNFLNILTMVDRAYFVDNSGFMPRILAIYRKRHKFYIAKHQPDWATPLIHAFSTEFSLKKTE